MYNILVVDDDKEIVESIEIYLKSEDTDKIMGLNIGADDYITKPFNLLELIARVKSNLRRYVSLGNYNDENTVAVHIRRIREKIEINPKNPKCLKVVWGIGYKIEKL